MTDAGAGDVGRFGWAGFWAVCVVRLGLGCVFCWWGESCEEHVFSGEAGKALLKVDGLGDRDSYVAPSGHVGRSGSR